MKGNETLIKLAELNKRVDDIDKKIVKMSALMVELAKADKRVLDILDTITENKGDK